MKMLAFITTILLLFSSPVFSEEIDSLANGDSTHKKSIRVKKENLNDYDFAVIGGAGWHTLVFDRFDEYSNGVIFDAGVELPLNSQADIAIEALYYHWLAYQYISYYNNKTFENGYGFVLSSKFYLDYLSKRYRPSLSFGIHIPYIPITIGLGFSFEYVVNPKMSFEFISKTLLFLNFDTPEFVLPSFIGINFKLRTKY